MIDQGVEPKYPHIRVKLTERDGDAFSILNHVRSALKAASIPSDEIRRFTDEAISGTYTELLATCVKWVTVL